MNIRYWFYKLTGQRRRAGGIAAAATRKRNRMKPDATTGKPATESQMTTCEGTR